MKFILAFCLFLSLCSNAQLKYFVEYNYSMKSRLRDIDFDGKDLNHLVFNNYISIGIKKDKMLYSLGSGREDWFLYFFSDYPIKNQVYNYHFRTFHITPMIEREFKLPKSNFSFRSGVGCKFYYLNQMKDSLSFSFNPQILNSTKPSAISVLNPYASQTVINGVTFKSKDEYYYITSVPYALTANFAIQYAFKKWAIKLQYEPTLMRVKTRNAANSNLKSSVFFFYNNLGLGINYPLNFKKKEKKPVTNT
jgi:hypothetical protein